MSLLYAQVRREAMAWRNENGEHHPVVHPVKHVGFAGYVDMSPEGRDQWGMEDEDHDGHEDDFDEDLHEETRPEPTAEEEAHYDEHGEYPEDYYDRHDEAYGNALYQKKMKAQENDHPDHEDDELMDFVGNHGANSEFWHQHGTHGPVDIKHQPVYATQSHVSQNHLDKYRYSPGASTHRDNGRGDYLGDDAPMMVTHNGRLHVTEGHHRVAAALQRGDHHIDAYHFNADDHGGLPDSEGHMPGHEDYEEHWSA